MSNNNSALYLIDRIHSLLRKTRAQVGLIADLSAEKELVTLKGPYLIEVMDLVRELLQQVNVAADELYRAKAGAGQGAKRMDNDILSGLETALEAALEGEEAVREVDSEHQWLARRLLAVINRGLPTSNSEEKGRHA